MTVYIVAAVAALAGLLGGILFRRRPVEKTEVRAQDPKPAREKLGEIERNIRAERREEGPAPVPSPESEKPVDPGVAFFERTRRTDDS